MTLKAILNSLSLFIPQTILYVVTNNVGEFPCLNILSIYRVEPLLTIASIIWMSEEESKKTEHKKYHHTCTFIRVSHFSSSLGVLDRSLRSFLAA